MTPTTEDPVDVVASPPEKSRRRRGCYVWILSIVTLTMTVGGLTGLLVSVLRGRSDASSLRGHEADTTTTSCPDDVRVFDPRAPAAGGVVPSDLAPRGVPSPCFRDEEDDGGGEPVLGVVYEYTAPAAGRVRLAAWTVMVDAVTCACVEGASSTRTVTPGQALRVWTSSLSSNEDPLQFIAADADDIDEEEEQEQEEEPNKNVVVTPEVCPRNVPRLGANGHVPGDHYYPDATTKIAPPDCVPEGDAATGRYWELTVPVDGVLALHDAVLVDPDTCACLDDEAADVSAAKAHQTIRVWVTEDNTAPVEVVPQE